MKRNSDFMPTVQVLIAAALFGSNAPLAKLLLGKIEPMPLAALLYLGSGIGLVILKFAQRSLGYSGSEQEQLSKEDVPWLLGSIIVGGVLGHIVLMFSLRITPAATASLLFNLEAVATAILAALIFKEPISHRVWLAISLMTVAGIMLTVDFSGQWGISLGALGVLTACVCWGFDNNCMNRISGKDPVVIASIKGFAAGLFSLFLAWVFHSPMPGLWPAIGAMCFGSIGYGVSIALDILGMRSLGAARASALFGTAPFVGAALSIAIFHEEPSPVFLISIPLMLISTFMLSNIKLDIFHYSPSRHEQR